MFTRTHLDDSKPALSVDPEALTTRRLHDAVHAAVALVRRSEAEYAELAANGDAIQEDRDASRSLLEHARGELEAAREAVRRLEEGTYGLCAVCERPIGDERLAALPGVEMCVSCQSTR